METCESSTLDLALIALNSFLIVVGLILGYVRHQHVMSDNRRLLHVIEAKTAHADDVK